MYKWLNCRFCKHEINFSFVLLSHHFAYGKLHTTVKFTEKSKGGTEKCFLSFRSII